MLQNDSHLNCLCVMARLIEALAIYEIEENEIFEQITMETLTNDRVSCMDFQ